MCFTVAERNARAFRWCVQSVETVPQKPVQRMTVSTLLSNVQANDEHLEANLCTMLQTVRGTKLLVSKKE